VLADDLCGYAGDHALVGNLYADHRADRDHHVAANLGAGQDNRTRPQPRAGADAHQTVDRELASDRGAGVFVAVVLVGDVDVGAGPHVVADQVKPGCVYVVDE
jgi:hypothetical protein